MEFMPRFLALNIGPTIVELALVAGVMAALYSWNSGLAAVATCRRLCSLPVIVTERRNTLRQTMNETNTELFVSLCAREFRDGQDFRFRRAWIHALWLGDAAL